MRKTPDRHRSASIYSDFLRRRPSFLTGLASIFDFAGNLHRYEYESGPDADRRSRMAARPLQRKSRPHLAKNPRIRSKSGAYERQVEHRHRMESALRPPLSQRPSFGVAATATASAVKRRQR